MTKRNQTKQNQKSSSLRIYTRLGDHGQTQLRGGRRISKSHPRLSVYGTLDELNSLVGCCLSEGQIFKSKKIKAQVQPLLKDLTQIQHELFNAGTELAAPTSKIRNQGPHLSSNITTQLELRMDQMTEELPPLREFILPGGHPLASQFHLARTVCRRAERELTGLQKSEKEYSSILVFLNRLGDYFFVAARWSNWISGWAEETWKKK